MFRDLQALAKREEEIFLKENFDSIKQYLFALGNAHGPSITLQSVAFDFNRDLVMATYEQHRKDPLFDDYITTKLIPYEFFEADDRDAYIEDRLTEIKTAQLEADHKNKLGLLKQAEHEAKAAQEKLKKIRTELL